MYTVFKDIEKDYERFLVKSKKTIFDVNIALANSSFTWSPQEETEFKVWRKLALFSSRRSRSQKAWIWRTCTSLQYLFLLHSAGDPYTCGYSPVMTHSMILSSESLVSAISFNPRSFKYWIWSSMSTVSDDMMITRYKVSSKEAMRSLASPEI